MAVYAQEFNCRVSVMHDKITTGVDPSEFNTMQKSITDFMNSQKWSSDDWGAAEKIDCNIIINLVSNNLNGDPESYSATISATSLVHSVCSTSSCCGDHAWIDSK